MLWEWRLLQSLACKRSTGSSKDDFPGSEATPVEICRLANVYRMAANRLLTEGRSKDPITWAPGRLCAIHAVELYLNAFLLHMKHEPSEIRGFRHNFENSSQFLQGTRPENKD